MNIVQLKSPVLRGRELRFKEYKYLGKKMHCLERPSGDLLGKSFFDVVSSRTSRREFGILSEGEISSILWFTSNVKESHSTEDGFRWQHRPAPSGGGRHPIDTLVCNYAPNSILLRVYDPFAHTLNELETNHTRALDGLIAAIQRILPFRSATLLLFAAQFNKTISRYKHGESLVWRDAGVLIGMTYLVSEALGLNCCAFGITGEPWLSKMFAPEATIKGVGGCILGQRLSVHPVV